MTTEVLVVENDAPTPLDLLLYRRFGRETPGLVEKTLDANWGLPNNVLLPRGTRVVVEVPDLSPQGRLRKSIRLYD